MNVDLNVLEADRLGGTLHFIKAWMVGVSWVDGILSLRLWTGVGCSEEDFAASSCSTYLRRLSTLEFCICH